MARLLSGEKPQAVSRPSQSEITSIVDRENRKVSSSLKGLNAHVSIHLFLLNKKGKT